MAAISPAGRVRGGRVLGVDPGSTVTGYGVVEKLRDGRLRAVGMGALRGGGGTFPERLVAMYDGLRDVIAAHRPDEVAMEGIFYAANVKSALKLGHARGVLLLAAAHAGLTVAEYSPMEVKRAIVGYGRAEKQQVSQMVCVLLGLDEAPKPLDATDALAIAICHAHTGTLGRELAR